MSNNKDPESLEEVMKRAWEKVKNEAPKDMENADKFFKFENAKFTVNGQEVSGEVSVSPVSRDQILYDHLFALVERAILSCNGNDIDEVCRLVEAYDMLLAIGIAKEWIEEN